MFEDEQPSDEIKAYVEKQLSNNDWNVDVVLSHTVPYDYRPVDLFLSMIDQSKTMEVGMRVKKWALIKVPVMETRPCSAGQ